MLPSGAVLHMDSRRISVVAAAVTVISMAARWGPGWLLGRQVDTWRQTGESGLLPVLGSPGLSVSIYTYAIRTVELVVPLLVGVSLGVWLARRVESDELKTGLRAVAVGSGAIVAVPVGWVIVIWSDFDPASVALSLALSSNLVVAGPVFITVTAAAGVAVETLGVLEWENERETAQHVDDDAATTEREATS